MTAIELARSDFPAALRVNSKRKRKNSYGQAGIFVSWTGIAVSAGWDAISRRNFAEARRVFDEADAALGDFDFEDLL